MKSRLLSRRELERLSAARGVEALIAGLTRTVYRRPVEAALARAGGLACITLALHHDLESNTRRLRAFFRGEAARSVEIVLGAYDIHNLKAILRGLSTQAPPSDILATVLPVGELPASVLAELARAPDPRAAVDILASMDLRFARPLLTLRATRPDATTVEMEICLDQWYYRNAFAALEEMRGQGGYLHPALQLDADWTNVMTVLRLVHTSDEQPLLRSSPGAAVPGDLFVGPGRLSFSRLAQAADEKSVECAISLLAEHVAAYQAPLSAALAAYRSAGTLSAAERELDRFRLRWLAQLPARDPLGIGVLLGYLALKRNEVRNLRWLAHAGHIGLKPEAIRAGLELIP